MLVQGRNPNDVRREAMEVTRKTVASGHQQEIKQLATKVTRMMKDPKVAPERRELIREELARVLKVVGTLKHDTAVATLQALLDGQRPPTSLEHKNKQIRDGMGDEWKLMVDMDAQTRDAHERARVERERAARQKLLDDLAEQKEANRLARQKSKEAELEEFERLKALDEQARKDMAAEAQRQREKIEQEKQVILEHINVRKEAARKAREEEVREYNDAVQRAKADQEAQAKRDQEKKEQRAAEIQQIAASHEETRARKQQQREAERKADAEMQEKYLIAQEERSRIGQRANQPKWDNLTKRQQVIIETMNKQRGQSEKERFQQKMSELETHPATHISNPAGNVEAKRARDIELARALEEQIADNQLRKQKSRDDFVAFGQAMKAEADAYKEYESRKKQERKDELLDYHAKLAEQIEANKARRGVQMTDAERLYNADMLIKGKAAAAAAAGGAQAGSGGDEGSERDE